MTLILAATSAHAHWTPVGQATDGQAMADISGRATAISGDGTVIAMGATLNDASSTDAGNVRVYKWGGTAWQQKGAELRGTASNDYFGRSIDLSFDGRWLVIGADGYDISTTATDAGQVTTYRWNGASWASKFTFQGESEERSGESVAFSNDDQTMAFGQSQSNGIGGTGASTASSSTRSVLELTTYPNPAKNVVYVKGVNLENSILRVLDILGKEQEKTTGENSLDIKALHVGVYYLQIENNDSQYMSKFTKQ